MGSHSPLQIVLWIIAGLAGIGVIVTYLRTRMTYSGYEEIVGDIRKLSSSLRGETFRDGADVVVSGEWEKNPVVVRFSNQENTPGLNIRMPAAATFQLSVVAVGVQPTEGPRTPVKTTDDMFDARFTTRTDQPMNARLLLTKSVTATLQRLACSKNTYIAVGSGSIEQSELVIPSPGTAAHVIEHLKSMASLAKKLKELPGSEKVKLYTIERERHVFARVVMAVGVAVAVLSIVAAMQVPPRAQSGENATLANGILPVDANYISDVQAWHAATKSELDSSGVETMRSFGSEASGRVAGDFSGNGNGQDAAYLLVNAEGKRRVVIIANRQKKYDAMYPSIGFIARVPKNAVNSIQWKNDKGPGDVDGDGLLIVRQPQNEESGVVVFFRADAIASAIPTSWGNALGK